MPTFLIDPMPTMISQTYVNIPLPFGYHIPVIDPTCGRFCLKALLKYYYEKHFNVRPHDVELPKPVSRMNDWIGFDPYGDFIYGKEMLKQTNYVPDSIEGWIGLLKAFGPVILSGKLGGATIVGHCILLVGAKSEGNVKEFYYKDPLVGDAVQTEAFATMQPKIEKPLVSASAEIMSHLQKVPAKDVNGLSFKIPK